MRSVSSRSERIVNKICTSKARTRNPLCFGPIWPKMDRALAGSRLKTLSAKDAKYGFGRLIDVARAEPVAVAKHGRPVVVVMAVKEYERLKFFETGHGDSRPRTTGRQNDASSHPQQDCLLHPPHQSQPWLAFALITGQLDAFSRRQME